MRRGKGGHCPQGTILGGQIQVSAPLGFYKIPKKDVKKVTFEANLEKFLKISKLSGLSPHIITKFQANMLVFLLRRNHNSNFDPKFLSAPLGFFMIFVPVSVGFLLSNFRLRGRKPMGRGLGCPDATPGFRRQNLLF